jgi:Protein of unknown function (DUF723)
LKAFNYKCFISGLTNTKNTPLVCHYLESWDLNPEKRLCIQNGVVLLKSLHKEFHTCFDFGNNTLLQFEKFCSENFNIDYFPWRKGNHEPSFRFLNGEKVKTFREIKHQELSELAENRGHQLKNGAYTNCRSSFIIFCPLHNSETQTTFTNYKKSKFGCLCCARAKQSQAVRFANSLRYSNSVSKKEEGAETRR